MSYLVKQQNVCSLKHCSGHRQFHAPTSRQSTHSVVGLRFAVLCEAHRGHDCEDFVSREPSKPDGREQLDSSLMVKKV